LLLDSAAEPSAFALARSLRFRRAAQRVLHTVSWNLGYVRRTGLRTFVKQKAHNLAMNVRIMSYEFLSACAPAFRAASLRDFLTVEEAFIIALENYVPEPYDGTAALLRTGDSISYDPENAGLWSGLVKGLDIVDVPGDHESMFQQPNVRVLADTIASYLEGGGKRTASALSSSTTR